MTCEKCGSQLGATTSFCEKCGTPTRSPDRAVGTPLPVVAQDDSPVKTTKTCPFCGESILEVALKCRFCGSDLSGRADVQHRAGSNIMVNAPQSAAVGAGPAPPSIIIQNVQSQQAAPGFVPGRYKNPALAAFLSIVFPGGGQFYNGHAGKGILILLTFWLVIPWIWGIFDAYSCAQRINRVGF